MASWQLLTYLLLTYSTGFSIEDTVFVMTGAFVHLNIQTDKPDKFEFITWKKEKSEYVVRYTHESKKVKGYTSYINRTDFNTESFSLTLKNMKKTDSAVYTAIASGDNDKLIAEHRVSVIDAVEAPVLTLNSGWSSTGLCNFTCKADIITINTVINNTSSCSEEVTSSGVYNLNLRCINDSIICNYSNPISSKNDTKTIEQICTITPDLDKIIDTAHLHWLIPIICISALGLLGTVVGLLFFYKNKKGAQNDTVYEEFEEKNKSQKSQEMLNVGSVNANTVYDTADKQPETTPTPDSINQSNPKTIYCAIQKLPTPPASSESDKTIYAVVNKHSTVCETVH